MEWVQRILGEIKVYGCEGVCKSRFVKKMLLTCRYFIGFSSALWSGLQNRTTVLPPHACRKKRL